MAEEDWSESESTGDLFPADSVEVAGSSEGRIDDTLEPGDLEIAKATRELKKLIAISASYTGPIPPPSLLKGYHAIDPALVDEIMRRWGAEQDHRHMQDRKHLDAQVRMGRTGQYLGTVCLLAAVTGTTVIGVLGGNVAGPTASSAIMITVCGIMGGVYVYERSRARTRAQQDDSEE